MLSTALAEFINFNAFKILRDYSKFGVSHVMTLLTFYQALAAKKLLPLFDRILIRRAEAITKTKGGIVIPEKAQAKVLQGEVIAVGPGMRNNVCLMLSFAKV
jgi:Chaperonin 10 Kd subunit